MSATEIPTPRLKERYHDEVRPRLQERFSITATWPFRGSPRSR